MLYAVAMFGVMTLVFSLSNTLWLSMVALAAMGASDMVSVVVRSTVTQLAVPPEMRGRVGAVNSVFISASNELGEWESGMTAHWFGAKSSLFGSNGHARSGRDFGDRISRIAQR